MKASVSFGASVAAVLCCLFGTLEAHGPGGAPNPPPAPTAPTPISPPPAPQGGKTGGIAYGPARPGGAAARANPTASGVVKAPAGRTGRTGGSSQGSANAFTGDAAALNTWELWWEHNKEDLLLRGSALTSRPISGSSGALTSRGRARSAVDDSTLVLQRQVVTVLRDVLGKESDPELCDSAALALARVATDEASDGVLADIRSALQHEALSVRTSATLSLGVLGTRKSMPLLNALMADTSAGRQALDGGAVPWDVRAYAALSLGLINDPLAIEPLADVMLHASESERQLRAAAAAALGLMQNDESAAAVGALLECISTGEIDAVVRACAVTSLARHRETAVLPTLLKLLEKERTEQVVRQSIVLALGSLGNLRQPETVGALRRRIAEDSDAATRQFAWIALARIAGDDTSEGSQPERAQLADVLRDGLVDPERLSDRPWAALAAGLFSRNQPTSAPPLQMALARVYAAENDPSVKAALAVALGLAGASEAGDNLLADLRQSTDAYFQGYAAIGLGLLGHRDGMSDLLALCRSPSVSDSVRQQLASAIALLQDPGAVPVLLAELADTDSIEYAWSVSRALGQIRDPRAIGPLMALAADDGQRVVSRAFACVALGLISDKLDLRFNTELERDYNYLAGATVIDEVVNL